MNYKILSFFFISLVFLGCDQNINRGNKIDINIKEKYSNSGFALIYNDNLEKIKKMDDRSLFVYHKSLKKKSTIKITNPKNGKSLIAEVKSNRQNFSEFYNSIISKRIAEDLELNTEEPYIEIILISKDSTFIAKKSKTFEAEKKVAEKAPIDGIQINDLNKSNEKESKITEENFSFSIKLADFYYKNTAQMMISRIKDETSIKNPKIIKLSKTKFRVLIGPFNDIKSLKETFEELKSLKFENIEMIRNV